MRLIDYFYLGGPIMYPLLVFNILGLTIMIWKLYTLSLFKKNLTNQASEIKNFVNQKNLSLEHTKDEVSNKIKDLETGLSTVKMIATISPLLGLLGTVLGILMAFEVISKQGMNDPSEFAGGISVALITTVGGLIVAIPHYIGYNYLARFLDKLEYALEKEVIK